MTSQNRRLTMKDNQAKYPQLRFKGFTDPWEERKLGEIGSFKNGMNFGKDAMGHGSPFVNLQNIFGKNIVDDTTLELAESTEKQKVEYSLIKGDVLFIRSSVKPSGVGEAALVDSNLPDTTYSGFIIRFRPKIDIDNNFKRFAFGTKYVRNQIMARATSSANTNINQDSLSLIQVGLPNLKEQEKIGSFFKQLDDTIALHQRKLDLLKEQKKGYVQKMFPKNGAKVPELRFAGFADAWEQRKLGEIVDRFDNLRIPVTASKREKGTTPYYGANGIQDYIKGYTHDGNFVLVAEDGANDLQNYPVHYVSGKVWVNNHAHVIQGKNGIVDNLFLVNAIKGIKFETYLVGGSRAKLNADTMMKLSIKAPSFSEQQQIGSYFSKLDSLIALHQRKLEKLQELKKGYLQKMFC